MDPLRHVPLAQKFALARALRRLESPTERYAWSLLRNRRILNLKFRRQHVVCGFIVDFLCVTERLVVELEGDSHEANGRGEYDTARAEVLEAAGYRLVRIRNCDVTPEHLEARLRVALGRPPIVPPLPKGEGDRG
jgi:very-short-patch-repair endonuclease